MLESFTLENIFLVMFLVGFLFTVLSAIMSGAFGHAFGEGTAFEGPNADIGSMGGEVGPTAGEGAPEVGWAQHNLATFSPLSPTTISAFLTAAGGAGWLCVARWEMSAPVSILMAVIIGLAFATITFLLIAWVFRVTQSTSMVTAESLVGHAAEVSIRINSGGIGEVAFVSAGQRCVMQARCVDASTLPVGTQVVIKSVTPTVYYVEESRESWLARTKSESAKAAH